jgi:two-component system sensor histidine kinase KdpD
LPTAIAQYWPLVTPGGIVGVMGVRMRHAEQLSVDQEALLETFVSHIALAVERELLEATSRHQAVLAASQGLYATLVDTVSVELQTPVTTVSTAIQRLLEPQNRAAEDLQTALGEEIFIASEQLKRLVDNLRQLTRLESGQLTLNIGLHKVKALVDASLKRLSKELAHHDLVVDVPPDLPLVPFDFTLMEQVLVNLLHNAAIYTPHGARIRVIAKIEGSQLVLSIADRGPGLPLADFERLFEKFYRAPGAASAGTGLGLSICRGLVQAHGGTITAENRPTHGGARFIIHLPLRGPQN